MVDIISKKSGPRREDVVAKKLINKNWSTISRLADQISNGGYSKTRATLSDVNQKPTQRNSNIHIVGGGSSITAETEPVLKISLNNRVIIVDAQSGKQITFLGEFRFHGRQKYFCLASKENGFFSTLDEETETKLADLNGVVIESDVIQQAFTDVIKKRLDL